MTQLQTIGVALLGAIILAGLLVVLIQRSGGDESTGAKARLHDSEQSAVSSEQARGSKQSAVSSEQSENSEQLAVSN